METRVSSQFKEVVIRDNLPTVVIGERINPSANKKLAEALRNGDLEFVKKEAVAQVKAGADIIDVNVGAFGVDEVEMLPKVVAAVMEAVQVPLCIDNTNPIALEAALKLYKGKALVNSISGEERALEKILPLIKEFKAAVIGLAQDDRGVPRDGERRIEVAHKIVTRAEAAGVKREDIVIDCLAPAIGAAPGAVPDVLRAIARLKAELGVNMTLGASNVSFGLPDRALLNNAFIPLVIEAGVTCMITDARRARPTILAADLLLAKDKRARRYIDAYRQRETLLK